MAPRFGRGATSPTHRCGPSHHTAAPRKADSAGRSVRCRACFPPEAVLRSKSSGLVAGRLSFDAARRMKTPRAPCAISITISPLAMCIHQTPNISHAANGSRHSPSPYGMLPSCRVISGSQERLGVGPGNRHWPHVCRRLGLTRFGGRVPIARLRISAARSGTGPGPYRSCVGGVPAAGTE
jgi:hypothetical protein